MLTRYNAWADDQLLNALEALPPGEAEKERLTVFRNMVHTVSHIYVIGSIFQAHLEGRAHGYTARNTPTDPLLPVLHKQVDVLDRWYVAYADALSPKAREERVPFKFIGGGDGVMSREEILLHIVTHASYHRGMVADLMFQVPTKPPVIDLTVYLRDVFVH